MHYRYVRTCRPCYINHARGGRERAKLDLFKQRFAEAPRVLELQLPKLKLNREPPDPLLHDDTWKTEGMRAEDFGEMP